MLAPTPRPTIRVVVRLFASLRERLGTDRISLDLPEGAPASAVFPALFPAEASSGTGWPGPLMYAVGHAYVTAETPLADGDEVALIPPLGGG